MTRTDTGAVQDSLARLRHASAHLPPPCADGTASVSGTPSPSTPAPAKRARRGTTDTANQPHSGSAASTAAPDDDTPHAQQMGHKHGHTEVLPTGNGAPTTRKVAVPRGGGGDSGGSGDGASASADVAAAETSSEVSATAPSSFGVSGVPSGFDGARVPPVLVAAVSRVPSVVDATGIPPGVPSSVLDPARVSSGLELGAEAISARGLSWKEKQRRKKVVAAAAAAAGVVAGKGKKKRGQERDFDHSRWRKRTVAFQLMYEGGGYAGFCSQVW